MGFFKRIKEDPVYNLPEELTGGFIQPLSSKLVKVEIGSRLKVQRDWNAIIVAKDTPLDVFDPGDHKLSIPNLPKTTTKLRLDKSRVIRRHGKPEIVFPKGFMCDIYFVNMGEFTNQQWQTHNVCLRDRKYGRFFVQLSGTYDFQCDDVAHTIHLFLLERGFIKVGYAQKRLQEYVNEFVAEMLHWMRPASPEIICDKDKMAGLIISYLNTTFKKYGIMITRLDVLGVDFDKHVASLLGETRAKRLELENENEYFKDAKDIVSNLNFDDDELVIVGASERQKEKEAHQKIRLKPTSRPSQDYKKTTTTLNLTRKANVKPKEQVIEEVPPGKKRCPKCGRICKDSDLICDCGCNLD